MLLVALEEGRRTSTTVVAGVQGADEEGECTTAGGAEDQSGGPRMCRGSHCVVCDLG